MGFAQGFSAGSSGLRGALELGFAEERAKREDTLKLERHKSDMEERGLRIGAAKRVDTATNELDTATRVGVRNQEGIKANDAEFEMANDAAARGLNPAKFDPAAQAPEWGKASDRDINQRVMALAGARGDTQGVLSAQDRYRMLDIRDIDTKVAKMPVGEVEGMLPMLNTNQSGYPILYTGKGKGGYEFLSTDQKGNPGQKFTMNESQVRQLARAHALGQAGFGQEALSTLAGAHKEIGDHISQWNSTLGGVAKTNNDATHKANGDEYQRGMLNVARSKAGAEKQGRMGAPIQVIGANGDPQMLQPVMDSHGQVTMQAINLPAGSRLPKQVDPARIEARAAALEGKPTGRLTNGKPEVYTAESAYRAAYEQVAGGPAGGSGAGASVKSDAKAILDALPKEGGTKAPAEEPQRGVPRLGRSNPDLEQLVRAQGRPAPVQPDWENMQPTSRQYGTKGW